MTRPLAGLVVLLLAACGVPARSPLSSTASGSSHAEVTNTQQSGCRLPIGISWGAPAVTPGSVLSGFLAYPGGSFTPDPSSNPIGSPYHGPNESVGSPSMPSYDWQTRRWLPVPTALISPDGATYAYTELTYSAALPTAASGPRFSAPTGTAVHVVDVAAATDHVILTTKSWWAAVGYSGGLLYLIDAGPEVNPDGSLFTLDVATGAIQEVAPPAAAGSAASPIQWTVIGSDAAWGTDPDGHLARLDLRTKNVSIWLSNSGGLWLITLDQQGRPIVNGAGVGASVFGARLVTAPGQTVEIANTTLSVEDVIADTHGIWLLSGNDVYLWAPSAGLTLIGLAAVQTNQIAGLAGHCQ